MLGSLNKGGAAGASVSASVQDPDNAFNGFSYAPPQDDNLN